MINNNTRTFSLANYILKKIGLGKIKHMKLQKLTFFCCGWSYAINEEWIIDDDFYAWPYGPVCPELYHEVSQYQNNPITKKIRNKSKLDAVNKEVVDKVLEVYGGHSDWGLSNITHEEGSPWQQTIKEKHVGSIIDKAIIYEFYKKRLEKNE